MSEIEERTPEEWQRLQSTDPLEYARAMIVEKRASVPRKYEGMRIGTLDDRDAEALVGMIDGLRTSLSAAELAAYRCMVCGQVAGIPGGPNGGGEWKQDGGVPMHSHPGDHWMPAIPSPAYVELENKLAAAEERASKAETLTYTLLARPEFNNTLVGELRQQAEAIRHKISMLDQLANLTDPVLNAPPWKVRAETAEAALAEANALIAQYKQDFSQMNREWTQAEEALAAEQGRGRVLRKALELAAQYLEKHGDDKSLQEDASMAVCLRAALSSQPTQPDAREERIAELEVLLEDWRECWVRNGGSAYQALIDRTRDILSHKSKEIRHQWWCRGEERCSCTDSWKEEEKARVAALSTSSEPEGRDA
jgi:hypothetical protein